MRKLLIGLMVLVVLVSLPMAVSAETIDNPDAPVVEACIKPSEMYITFTTPNTPGTWQLVNSPDGLLNINSGLTLDVNSNGLWTVTASDEKAANKGYMTNDDAPGLPALKILANPLEIRVWSDSGSGTPIETANYATTTSPAAILQSSYDQNWIPKLRQKVDTSEAGLKDKVLDVDHLYEITVTLTATNDLSGAGSCFTT